MAFLRLKMWELDAVEVAVENELETRRHDLAFALDEETRYDAEQMIELLEGASYEIARVRRLAQAIFVKPIQIRSHRWREQGGIIGSFKPKTKGT